LDEFFETCFPLFWFVLRKVVLRLPAGSWSNAVDCRELNDCVVGTMQWSFRRAWPRIGTSSCGILPFHVLPNSADIEGAKRALWRMPQFEPPLTVCFAPFDEGALIHISVTHMTSDGYCLMPLLADLAHFVAQEEAAAGSGPQLAPPPPLPSALTVLESRIMQTIDGNSASNDAPTLDPISAAARAWRAP